MGFWSWLTGRDEKESDVYANYDKVDEVVTKISNISSTELADAETNIKQALDDLNNVKGVSEYVGTVNVGAFTSVFEQIGESVKNIGTQLQGKADDIKAYEESSWWEKGLSTFTMTAVKIGEGILSVAEDLGDGIVSLVGWVAPKDSGLEKACTSFVEKEWSHDTFNFYYQSDFAKKSAFTEDSAIAGACKIAGSTAGYLFAGGALAGAAGAVVGQAGTAAAKGAKLAQGVVKVAGAASKIGSSTTLAATAIAGVAGLGSGTEAGLRNGMDINDAFVKSGVKQGAINAGLAFAGGKLGEKMAKGADIKGAKGALDKADDAVRVAQDKVDDAAKLMADAEKAMGPNSTVSREFAMQQMDDAIEATTKARQGLQAAQTAKDVATSNLDDIASRSLSSYQGYSDAITKTGQKVGANATTNVLEQGIIKGTLANGKAILEGTMSLPGKAIEGIQKIPGNLSAAKTAIAEKGLGTVAKESIVAPVVNAVKSPATPGVIAQGVDATINTSTNNANAQFQAERNNPTNPKNTLPTDEGIKQGVQAETNDPTIGAEQFRKTEQPPTTSDTTAPPGGGGGGGNGGGGGGDTPVYPTVSPETVAPTVTPTTVPTTVPTTSQPGTPPPTMPDTTPYTQPYTPNTQPYTPGTQGGTYDGSDMTFDTGEIDDLLGLEDAGSIADIIEKGTKGIKLPTANKPYSGSSTSGGASAVIPIAAGLSAAAAAGIGAKAYMDRKNNSENGEDDEYDDDEWDEEATFDTGYDDSSNEQLYLDSDDDMSYQDEEVEKYGARSNEELADLQ